MLALPFPMFLFFSFLRSSLYSTIFNLFFCDVMRFGLEATSSVVVGKMEWAARVQ